MQHEIEERRERELEEIDLRGAGDTSQGQVQRVSDP